MIKSIKLFQDYQLDLTSFEENFHLIIDSLFFLKFGPIKTELIMWYLYEREIGDDGKIVPLVLEDDKGELSEKIIENPGQLWDFMETLKK